jgi:hypothetical protein
VARAEAQQEMDKLVRIGAMPSKGILQFGAVPNLAAYGTAGLNLVPPTTATQSYSASTLTTHR